MSTRLAKHHNQSCTDAADFGLLAQGSHSGTARRVGPEIQPQATIFTFGFRAPALASRNVPFERFFRILLVSRFRGSPDYAAPPDANFGIEGTLANISYSAVFGSEVPLGTRGNYGRNFTSTTLGEVLYRPHEHQFLILSIHICR